MTRELKQLQIYLRIFVAMLFLSAISIRCASVMTPDGGPKDTIPPVIVNMLPDNYTTNFDEKKIYIEFDEFVQIKDQQKEFFTSPKMKKKPLITQRGRGIVITIRDTLLENTTYALNFGSAIRDNNEGNPLNSMRYVFSTGDKVDSMIVSGYTVDAKGADSVSKSFVYFYPVDSINATAEYDSTLFTRSPAVIARAENNGIYLAQNIKPIDYRVYTFQDKNDNQTYEPGTDLVGFNEEVFNPLNMPEFSIWYDSTRNYVVADPQIYTRLFMDTPFRRQIIQEQKRPLQHKAEIYFGAGDPQVDSIVFDSISSDSVIYEYLTDDRDTLNIWFNVAAENLPDTIKGRITYHKHDSLNTLQPTTEDLKLAWKFFESKDAEKKRKEAEKALEKERERAEAEGKEWVEPKPENTFKHKLSSGTINPELGLTIDFDYPLTELDSAAISMMKITKKDNKADSTALKVNILRDTTTLLRYTINTKWEDPQADYALLIPEGAIRNVAGEINDSITGNYKVMDPEKFATVIANVTVDPTKGANYVVELLDGKSKLLQHKSIASNGAVQFNYVPAGEIRLRVIEDMNHNGKWDSGNLVEMRQSERSEIFSQDGTDIFTTKENWELTQDINMTELFAPITMESVMKTLEEQETKRMERIREERIESERKRQEQKNQSHSSGGGFSMGNITNAMGGM